MPNDFIDPSDLALHQLAKRKRPDHPFANAVQWIDFDEHHEGGYMCLICEAPLGDIMANLETNEWADHGKTHLKESGLLVML